MCGICGVAGRVRAGDDLLVQRMADTLQHRGPDDEGLSITADGRTVFGHRRLAIIDLSPGGHQPMVDSSEGLTLVFNGEIYNYRSLREELHSRGIQFRTQSDTEVILKAYAVWGSDMLMRLNGMFAIALYDARRRHLLLARDRAGEKPLYYRLADGSLHFASELKALLVDSRLPRHLDRDAFEFYLAYGHVPGDMCLVSGVRKLRAGHAIVYDTAVHTIQEWRYWQLPEPTCENPDPEELLWELERILEDSVRLRLVADVPVGILLSGGIDSSLVTAMAARVSSTPVRTFTATFPGYGTVDEGPYARIVAEEFGTSHLDLQVEPSSVDILPRLARQFDEPLGDHSILPTALVSQLIRRHATVALGGDGGDELFGGYPHYNLALRMDRWRKRIPRSIRKIGAAFAQHGLPVGTRGRNHLIGFGSEVGESLAHINVYFDASARRRLLRPTSRPVVHPEDSKAQLSQRRYSTLQQATRLDFGTTMVDDYLVKVDRASMLSSLEIRAPFLDHRLIEFAFGKVPDDLRATASSRKVLLRRLAQRILPARLDLNRKQGFTIPLGEWMAGSWRPFLREVLDGLDTTLFNTDAVKSLLKVGLPGSSNAHRLFAILMFELWRREYGITAADHDLPRDNIA